MTVYIKKKKLKGTHMPINRYQKNIWVDLRSLYKPTEFLNTSNKLLREHNKFKKKCIYNSSEDEIVYK